MRHDPACVADTAGWLRKSSEDLKAAKHLLKAPRALSGAAVFHCQQAAEKALKAFLAWHDVPFRKTHDLEEIGEACIKLDPTLEEVVDRAVPLTEYAWKFRYPGEAEHPARKEVESALAIASEVYREIAARLAKHLRR
jgi:HEPN domain-containing protein